MKRRCALSATAAAVAAAVLLLPAAAVSAKPAAGPQIADCGKLKKNKGRFSACKQQNKANRVAFNQIKNSNFDGERGDGQEVDHIFCANGKWESRTTSSYGTGVSTGERWRIVESRVRSGGKWINAFLRGPGGYYIAFQKRGAQWKIGVASSGRILYPGDVEKTNAAKECSSLEV